VWLLALERAQPVRPAPVKFRRPATLWRRDDGLTQHAYRAIHHSHPDRDVRKSSVASTPRHRTVVLVRTERASRAAMTVRAGQGSLQEQQPASDACTTSARTGITARRRYRAALRGPPTHTGEARWRWTTTFEHRDRRRNGLALSRPAVGEVGQRRLTRFAPLDEATRMPVRTSRASWKGQNGIVQRIGKRGGRLQVCAKPASEGRRVTTV